MRFVDRDGGCRIAEINALHLFRRHSIWNVSLLPTLIIGDDRVHHVRSPGGRMTARGQPDWSGHGALTAGGTVSPLKLTLSVSPLRRNRLGAATLLARRQAPREPWVARGMHVP